MKFFNIFRKKMTIQREKKIQNENALKSALGE